MFEGFICWTVSVFRMVVWFHLSGYINRTANCGVLKLTHIAKNSCALNEDLNGVCSILNVNCGANVF
jgi:hypothetical protein